MQLFTNILWMPIILPTCINNQPLFPAAIISQATKFAILAFLLSATISVQDVIGHNLCCTWFGYLWLQFEESCYAALFPFVMFVVRDRLSWRFDKNWLFYLNIPRHAIRDSVTMRTLKNFSCLNFDTDSQNNDNFKWLFKGSSIYNSCYTVEPCDQGDF